LKDAEINDNVTYYRHSIVNRTAHDPLLSPIPACQNVIAFWLQRSAFATKLPSFHHGNDKVDCAFMLKDNLAQSYLFSIKGD
jgi:hypothetical protein